MSGCDLLLRVWSSSFYELFAGSYRISGGEGCGVVWWDVVCI